MPLPRAKFVDHIRAVLSLHPRHEAYLKHAAARAARRILRAAVLLAAVAGVAPASTLGSAVVSLKEIREAGVVIQQWDTSCGAAALATVLTYHFDDPVTEREVAEGLLRQTEPLKVRHRGGFSLLDMKRYARERGYRAIGFKGLSFEELRYFEAPIVPINLRGYNHYVVFKGVTVEGQIRLGDPAFGNHVMSRERFQGLWMNGMAFALLSGQT